MSAVTFESLLKDGNSEIESMEIHRRKKLMYLGKDDADPLVVNYKDIYLNTEADAARRLCVCISCGSKVGVSRFAMHLETCSRRGRKPKIVHRVIESKVASGCSIQEKDMDTTGVSNQATSTSGENKDKKSSLLGKRLNPNVDENGQTRANSKNAKSKSSAPQANSSGKDSNIPTTSQKSEPFRCTICFQDAHKLEPAALCDGCDRGYHMKCLKESLPAPDSNNVWREVYDSTRPWLCKECVSNTKRYLPGKLSSSYGMTADDKIHSGRRYSPCGIILFFCDVCNNEIQSMRYRCLVCNNFDMCHNCYVKHTTSKKRIPKKTDHDTSHAMFMIEISRK